MGVALRFHEVHPPTYCGRVRAHIPSQQPTTATHNVGDHLLGFRSDGFSIRNGGKVLREQVKFYNHMFPRIQFFNDKLAFNLPKFHLKFP